MTGCCPYWFIAASYELCFLFQTPEQRYSSFKGLRTVSIKKVRSFYNFVCIMNSCRYVNIADSISTYDLIVSMFQGLSHSYTTGGLFWMKILCTMPKYNYFYFLTIHHHSIVFGIRSMFGIRTSHQLHLSTYYLDYNFGARNCCAITFTTTISLFPRCQPQVEFFQLTQWCACKNN